MSNPYADRYTKEERSVMNRVYKQLFHNKETWFKSKELETMLGLKGAEIREIVHNIRVEGYPIVSGPKGYKYATNTKELDKSIASMFSRIGSIGRASQGLVKARKRFFDKQLNVNSDDMEQFFNRIRVALTELEEHA